MTPDVDDFPALIRWVADTYHRGKFMPIAKRTKISNALIDKWRYGLVASPRMDTINKLCDAYGLDFLKVMLLFATRPTPPGRRKRRTAAVLLALGLAYTLGAVPAQALPAPSNQLAVASYRKRHWLEIIREVIVGWREIVHAPPRRTPQLWDLPTLPALA